MLIGLQSLISNYCFIGTTSFFKYKKYVLLLKKTQGMYLKECFLAKFQKNRYCTL